MSIPFPERTKEQFRSQQEAAAKAEAEAQTAESMTNIKNTAANIWKSRAARWRFMWNVRGQMVAALIGCGIGGYFMVFPVVREAIVEIFQYHRPTQSAAEALPTLSVSWWTNQWRKGVQTWRSGETEDGFYHPVCDYIEDVTGKDIRAALKAHNFDVRRASRVITPNSIPNETPLPSTPASVSVSSIMNAAKNAADVDPVNGERRAISDPNFDSSVSTAGTEKRFAFESKFKDDATRPRALVPMCGDSPMVRHLADFGYNVDGVDSADVAIRSLAEASEQLYGGWNDESLHRMQLYYSDLFEPALWRALPKGGYDLIYDRQGLSAIDPEAREDYAFLLKKALKPDGLLYVEGTFRTKRVHRNRRGGPPFHFGSAEISNLFPLTEGWVVKCQAMRELERSDLSPEARVVGQVPKELWIRHFPCVVRKDEAGAEALLRELATKEFA